MQPAGGRTDMLGHRGGEGNHVVMGDPLDLLDARHVEAGLGSQLTRGVGRHETSLGHRISGRQLHVEPRLVATLLGPDVPHFGVGVALNHASDNCSAVTGYSGPPPSTVSAKGPAENTRWATRSTAVSVTASIAASMLSSVSLWSP